MSERIVRRAVDAFVARDLDGILAVADGEIVLRSLLTEAERPLYYGHDGVRCRSTRTTGWGRGYEMARSCSSGSSGPRTTPWTR
jgi:hypothetical protein